MPSSGKGRGLAGQQEAHGYPKQRKFNTGDWLHSDVKAERPKDAEAAQRLAMGQGHWRHLEQEGGRGVAALGRAKRPGATQPSRNQSKPG